MGLSLLLAITGFFITTKLTLIIIVLFVGYFLYSVFSFSKKKKSKFGSSFLLLFVILPVSLGLALHYENFTFSELILHVLILYNYTLIVLFNMVLLPMSFYSIIRYKKTQHHRYFPSISIIIPAFNEEKVIEKTIQSILHTQFPKKEIFVVNNASTDKTGQVLQKYHQDVVVLDETNKGKAHAINKGIKESSGEIIIILDADTRVTKHALENIVRPFETEPKLSAVSGNVKVLNRNNVNSKIQVIDYSISMNLARGIMNLYKLVPVVSGAFGAFRGSIIRNKSPFTADTLTEDFDASITLLKRGYFTAYQNDAIAYTEVPERLNDFIRQRYRWFRGFLQGYNKHRDFFLTSSFKNENNIVFFFLLNSNLILPIVDVISITAIVPTILIGRLELAALLISLNSVNLIILSIYALRANQESLQYAKYSPFLIVYVKLLTYIFLKGMIHQFLKINRSWTHIARKEN